MPNPENLAPIVRARQKRDAAEKECLAAILQARLNGRTFEQLGFAAELSRQRVQKQIVREKPQG